MTSLWLRFFILNMAKRRSPQNQIAQIPEYGEIKSRMEAEAASIVTDYIRQYVGIAQKTPSPGSGIFMNFDRILNSQHYQELVWYDLYAEVERDPHVSAMMSAAKLNVAGMKYDVVPFVVGDDKKASKRDQEIADFVRDVLDGIGYFPTHLYNLMDALGKGFSVSEIMWKIDNGVVTVANIYNRPQRRIQFDAVSRTPKLRDLTNPYLGDPLPDKKFIIHRFGSLWENPFGDAIDQNIYWMWLFKRTVAKFWMTNLETATAPIPLVKHPASASYEMKSEALAVAQNIRAASYGRIPDNMEIVWAEAQNMLASNVSYLDFIRFCNDEISKSINGQTLTAEASSSTGTGTRALGSVHQATQSARDIYRAESLASTLNATLIKWIVDFNYDENTLDGYPQFRFDLEESEDLVRESEIVKNLSAAGFEIDPKDISDKFNYTVIKKNNSAPIPQATPNNLENQ